MLYWGFLLDDVTEEIFNMELPKLVFGFSCGDIGYHFQGEMLLNSFHNLTPVTNV